MRRSLPEELSKAFPEIADRITEMTNPISSLRPRTEDLLSTMFSNDAKEKTDLSKRIRDLEAILGRHHILVDSSQIQNPLAQTGDSSENSHDKDAEILELRSLVQHQKQSLDDKDKIILQLKASLAEATTKK